MLGGSAVALRVAILPAVLLQVRETRRLMALVPQFAIFRQQTAAIEPAAERARVLRAHAALCASRRRPTNFTADLRRAIGKEDGGMYDPTSAAALAASLEASNTIDMLLQGGKFVGDLPLDR